MARRATSLGPKPSLFIISFCWGGLFFLSSLCFLIQKLVFPLEKGIFCSCLSLSLCFSLAFFGLPLFQSLFLCLSLVLFFFYSFLFFLTFFWFLLFVFFVSFLLFLLCFCFMKGTTSKHFIAISFSSIVSLFLWFPVLFFFQIPFSYLCLFF